MIKKLFRGLVAASAAGAVFVVYLSVSGQRVFVTADQAGARQFSNDAYSEAAESFRNPRWKAAAHYRDGGFKEAATIYSGFDTPDDVFNHANCLVMLGKYEDAIARYDRALELRPGWEDAETNRAVAVARAERVKLEGGDMTGGKLGADEYSFNTGKSNNDAGEEVVDGGQELTDAEMRALWLRRVETKPADFLRSKFAYQVSRGPEDSN